MRRFKNLCLFASILSTPGLIAQDQSFDDSGAPQPIQSELQTKGIGTEPVAGRIPGTHSYNVTFKTRSFDLTAFRTAVENRESAIVVEDIVRDLERRVIADQAEFKTAIEALGGGVKIQFWLINACNIDVPDGKLAAVEVMPNVLNVRPDLPTYPLVGNALPMIKVATDSSHHNADAEQAIGNTGTNVGIAIIDTSADSSQHGANQPHMVFYRNADRNNHGAGGLDGSRLMGAFAIGSQPANNSHPHGTGVAGIAAGAGWNTVGADRGHSSDARIVAYSICDIAGSCGSSFAIEAAGWQRAAADVLTYGIVTANMSYGSSPDPTDISQQAIDSCAINAGILPVTAAGNSGSSTAGSSSTANGLSVAAIDPSNKTVASFSSRGPLTNDTQRFFPDIAACGVNTVMPQFGNEAADYVDSGTSMASPQVCGAAGLVKNARPASNARELKALLLNNIESIAAQNPGLGRNDYGMGFLRDDIACSAARSNSVFSSTINSIVTPNTHSMAVVQNQIYAVTLVWNRHVLTTTAWSNLTLRIKNGATVIATSNSPRNLYERLEFTSPITGSLTIEVSAANLEIPNLPYAVARGLSSSNGLASVRRSGTGCVRSSSSFYELFSLNTIDLAASALRMTPSAGGYAVTSIPMSIVPPVGGGLALSDDSISGPLNLGFTMPFSGGSTSQVRVCSNGFIYLNGSGSSASYTPTVSDALTGGPRIFPMWTDLNPDGGTNVDNVFFNVDAPNNRVRITWRNVAEYGSTNRQTFQVVLNSNGTIDMAWQSAIVSGHASLVGFSPGNGPNDPGQTDITTSLPFQLGAERIPLAQNATRPLLNGTCNLLVSDIPASSIVGVELIGLESPGIDLTTAGMPTCFLYVSPSTFSIPFSTPGSSASVPLPIPNNSALNGIQLGVQAATITPSINALGVATSNLVVLGLGQF